MVNYEIWFKTTDGSQFVMCLEALWHYKNARTHKRAIWDMLECCINLVAAHPTTKISVAHIKPSGVDVEPDYEVLYDKVVFVNVDNIVSFEVKDIEENENGDNISDPNGF